MGEIQLHQLVNKTITLEGLAANGKAGAILLVNENPVYMESMGSWPEDVNGKKIVMRGRLVFKLYIAKAQSNESGQFSQGGDGEKSFVLEQAVRTTQT